MKRISKESHHGALWNREESLLAFELYCRIPFQKTKATNPAVRELAYLLGRTPASVARKLGNFGAFDPALQEVGIRGLTHTSKLDREIWDEFHADWNGLVWEANLLRKKIGQIPPVDDAIRPPNGPSETMGLTKQRVHHVLSKIYRARTTGRHTVPAWSSLWPTNMELSCCETLSPLLSPSTRKTAISASEQTAHQIRSLLSPKHGSCCKGWDGFRAPSTPRRSSTGMSCLSSSGFRSLLLRGSSNFSTR